MFVTQRQEEKEMWCMREKEVREQKTYKEDGHGAHRSHRHKYHTDDVHHHFRTGGHLDSRSGSGDKATSESTKATTSHKWAAELLRFEESLGDDRSVSHQLMIG